MQRFLSATHDGDFDRPLAVLDPDVVVRADCGPAGGSRVLHGAAAVAGQALGYAQLGLDIRPALINGVAGAVAFTGNLSRSPPPRFGTGRSSSSTSSPVLSASAYSI